MNSIGIDMKHSMRVVANTPHERSKAQSPVGATGEGESGPEAAETADFDSTATRLIEDYLSSQGDRNADGESQSSDTAQLDEVTLSVGASSLENDSKIGPGMAIAEGQAGRLPDDVLRFVELNSRGSRSDPLLDHAATARLVQGQDGTSGSVADKASDAQATKPPLPQTARPDHPQLAGVAIDKAETEKPRTAIERLVGGGAELQRPPGSELVTKGVQVTAMTVQPVGGPGTGQSQLKTGVTTRLESSEATLRSRLGEALLQREGGAAKTVNPVDQSVRQAQHRAGQQSLENEVAASISVEMDSRETLPNSPRANVVNLVANALSKELAGQSDFRLAGSGDAGSVFAAQISSGAATRPLKTMTIQLTPQHLGQVMAKIAYSGDELRIDLTPDNMDTVRLLRQDREVLIEMLRATGLNVPDEAVRVAEAVRTDLQNLSSGAAKDDGASALRQEAMESSDRRQREGGGQTAGQSGENEQAANSERERRSDDQGSRRGIFV